jgi:hypothetical protein
MPGATAPGIVRLRGRKRARKAMHRRNGTCNLCSEFVIKHYRCDESHFRETGKNGRHVV